MFDNTQIQRISIDHKSENGVVVEFTFFSDWIEDLSPVRAFAGLKRLGCRGNGNSGVFGSVTNLSPLQGMSLEELALWGNPKLTDLSALEGMPLKLLTISHAAVSDLTPLKGMQIETLWIDATKITDLSDLKGMPLKVLICDFKPERDTELLRSIKTLETINGKPAAEF